MDDYVEALGICKDYVTLASAAAKDGRKEDLQYYLGKLAHISKISLEGLDRAETAA